MIDLGTGDGRAVLARARQDPAALVIGIDASAAGMAESSLRAARGPRKGGLENALFVVAAAEQPPPELRGLAAELTILFPWGSLLRGALALDEAADAAAGIADLLAPDGRATAVLSIDSRDRLVLPVDALDPEAIARRWQPFGVTVCGFGPADQATIDATASSWARRLRAGRDRPVWALDLVRTMPSTEPPMRHAGSNRRSD